MVIDCFAALAMTAGLKAVLLTNIIMATTLIILLIFQKFPLRSIALNTFLTFFMVPCYILMHMQRQNNVPIFIEYICVNYAYYGGD